MPFLQSLLNQRIASMPLKGRGQIRKIAAFLNVHPTLLSQVLNTTKDLSLEQGIRLAEFLGLSENEREYFITLLEYERAGSKALKDYFFSHIQTLRKEAEASISKGNITKELREEDRAIFYSQWYLSAIRLLTSIEQYQTLDSISEKIKMPKAQVRMHLDFLTRVGLVHENSGAFKTGPSRTHVSSNSPHAVRHHVNWRIKAFEAYEALGEDEIAITLPMTISKADALHLREEISKFVKSLNPIIDASPSEELKCLNIDFFSPFH